MRRWRQATLTNERDELVGCDQKCDCIDKSKQPQNDKPRQPIGISQREKPFNRISQFMQPHEKKRRTSNTQRPTPNLIARGEIRTPDQPRMLSVLLYCCKSWIAAVGFFFPSTE